MQDSVSYTYRVSVFTGCPHLRHTKTVYRQLINYIPFAHGRFFGHIIPYNKSEEQNRCSGHAGTGRAAQSGGKGNAMKGYVTETGYMGYVGGRYQLFASENDYYEYAEIGLLAADGYNESQEDHL